MRTLRLSPASTQQLLLEARLAESASNEWRERAADGGRPRTVAAGAEVATAADRLRDEVAQLSAVLETGALAAGSLQTLERQVGEMARDEGQAARVARLRWLSRRLRELGVGPLIDELRGGPDPRLWPDIFEAAWLLSARERALISDPELAMFDGSAHDDVVKEFKRLDRLILQAAVDRVRRAHAEHAVKAMNAYPTEAAAVRHEAFKQKRHTPLRKLAVSAPHVLTALKPCWMASPLSISQLLLGSQGAPFDVVVFDEASQVLPEDAITALLRGRVAVVAGDRHQLPPTPFFVAGQAEDDEDADGAEATVGFESLLDAVGGFAPECGLQWHYRSEDERLIAFSNHEIYGLNLVTFPGVGRWTPIEHVLVPQVLVADGEELSSSAEVERVVDLILEHARERPEETLGVITMGIRHMRRIQARLDQARKEHPELDDFFDSEDRERQEPFFNKNLERVQGDERDAIILSIGYGKDRAGRLVYRFGPLLHDGGERRRNVAATRAKRRITVVSSFSHEDMDDAKLHSRGMRLLKQYLRFAASSGTEIYEEAGTAAERNPFELDVEDALRARGVEVVPQYGVSRYRIDLVAMHPKLTGRRVLAIECDGASYHSTPTVRDRDRLRQEHLERLGWRFVRIWSTDWYTRREEEIARVVAAYHDALAADGARARTTTRPAPTSAVVSSAPVARGPRPYFTPNLSIDRYGYGVVSALIRWVTSDGRLRTDKELLVEVARELGFQRIGNRIRESIQQTIDLYRGDARRSR